MLFHMVAGHNIALHRLAGPRHGTGAMRGAVRSATNFSSILVTPRVQTAAVRTASANDRAIAGVDITVAVMTQRIPTCSTSDALAEST